MLLRPHLWCGLNERPGGAEPGENLFTCSGSVVGYGDSVLIPCKLIALFLLCKWRSFDLTQNGHALCSAVNTQTIGTAGLLQMLEL